MNSVNVLFLLVTWHMIFGTVESAYVNATLPSATAIENGAKIEFLLDAFDPPATSVYYTLLTFGYEKAGTSFARLYNWNKFISVFVLRSPLPPEFVGRLSTSQVGNKSKISISPILFADETYQFYFELDYYTASGLSTKIDSQKYLLQNVYSKPTFDDSASVQVNTTLIEGIARTITCVVRSRPVSSVTWSYNNVTINATQSSSSSTSGSVTTVTSILIVSNPSASYEGERITCVAAHQFSSAVNRTTTINVQYRPKNTSLNVTPSNPKLNQILQLTCNAVGRPSVSKYRFYINDVSIGNSTNGSLTVNASDCATHSGIYKCVPETSIGDGLIKTQSVTVTDYIKVSSKNSTLTVSEAKNAILECDVTGCPLPTIQWKKGGAPLNKTGSRLQLTSVTSSDSGQYFCHAENGYTNGSAQIQVYVMYKPVSTNMTASNSKPREGSAVTFTCNADSYPPASFRFYRIDNGVDVEVNSAGSVSSGIYTESSVSYSGAYNVTYRCVPYNLLGNGTAVETSMEIQVLRLIMASAIPSTVNATQSAVIECKILAANPVPEVAIKNPYGIRVAHTNGNLTLTNVTANDGGIYQCEFWNSAGYTSRGTRLTVNHVPDNVNLASSNNKPVNGSTVTLTCSARGTPQPRFRFLSATNAVVQDSSSATFVTDALNYESVTNYSAIFRCVPYNMMGDGATASVKLDIQVPPRISFTITPQNVMETGSVNLSCVVAAANPSATLTLRSPRNSSITHTNGIATLSNVSRSDAGMYSCIAQNGVPGSPVTKTASFSVNHAPDQVRITATTTTPITGSSVTLNCSARAFPKPRFRFFSANGSILQDGASSYFVTPSLNHEEFTNYTTALECMAYNSFGETRVNIALNIQVPPVITFSINPSIVNESDSTTMQCTVISANPAPTISLQDPKGASISHMNGLASLSNITRDRGGNYSCIATNAVGSSSKKQSLTVNHPPDNVAIAASSLKPLNGSSVSFTCSARASPMAKYKFYALHGSSLTPLQDSSSATYQIKSIDYAGFVGYKATVRCIPYNSFGDGTSSDTTVDIQVRPLTSVPPAMTVIEGQNATFNCTVLAANPAPTIRWLFPVNTVLPQSNGVAVLKAVKKNWNGTYTCEASNGIGLAVNKTTYLTVHYGPRFTSNSSTITVCKPNMADIRCVAEGNPTPTVRVMFSGKEYKRGPRNITYIVTNLEDNTFGVYTCVANNSVKEVNITRTLVKSDAPGPLTQIKYKEGSTSIEVTWVLPVCTGANGINKIRIKYKKSGESQWMTMDLSGTQTKATVENLEKGATYDVQLVIVDSNQREHPGLTSSQRTGTTDKSSGSNAAMVGGIIGGVLLLVIIIVVCVAFNKRRKDSSTVIPSEPLHFSLQPHGNDKITVLWCAPVHVKLYEINHYDIYWKRINGHEDVKSVKAGSFEVEIDGLKSGTLYEFRIVAVMTDGAIGRCSMPKVQRTNSEYDSKESRGDTAKSDIPLKSVNGDGHYRAPDGSLYASVSRKAKQSPDNIDGAVDNPKFVADSDGAYDPVVPNNNASPGPDKKGESAYAELSTFKSPDNGKDKEKPVKTEYATLEEMGPLTPFENAPDEDPPSHKITVTPESDDVPEPEPAPPQEDSSAKVDII